MDCEKVDSLLLDALYGELDEVASAALQKHLADCAKCGAAFDKLSATRRAVAQELVPAPDDLEARIMAKVEAQAPPATTSNVVRLEPRFSRMVSAMGRWAMRPQTAMAAVFLLMIGSSALLLKGRVKRSPDAVTVTERGAPVAAMPSTAAEGRFDDMPDPSAHGLGGARLRDNSSVAQTAPVAAAPGLLGHNDFRAAGDGERDRLAQLGASNAAAPGGVAALDPALREATSPDDLAEKKQGEAPPAKAAGRRAADLEEAEPQKDKKSDSAFDAALAAYRARNFDDAVRRFDVLAKNGDTQAALYAARSVRDGHGCGSALTRFDQLASTAFGTPAGYDAALEAGICYRNQGHLDAASSRFNRLLMVPSHAARAQSELDQVHRIAQARADEAKARRAEASGGAAGASGAALAKPAAAPPAATSGANR